MELPWNSLRKQTDSFVDGIKNQLGGVILVVAVLWVAFAVDFVAYFFKFDFRIWFGLRPRHFTGLHGILTMPFVHADFGHLLGNSISLLFALLALTVLRPRSWFNVLCAIFVLSGVLTWLFGGLGGNTSIVGASGVVMGLITFLVAPVLLWVGWWGYNRITKQSKKFPLEIQLVPLVVGIVATLFYFNDLFRKLIPIPGINTSHNTSWSAHWCGAIAGLIVAFVFLKNDEIDDLGAPKQEKSILEETFS